MFRYHIIRILQITTAILLAGRAWQHFFWDVPYEFLFTERLGFTEWFNDQFTASMGWFYLIGVIFCFTLDNRNSKWAYVFVVYAASLLLLSQMFRASNNCEIPTLFLYTSQFATPLIYYQLQFTQIPIGRIMGTLKLSLTLTLAAYAWYAFGFYYGQKTAWLQGLNSAFAMEGNTAHYLLYGLAAVEILLILVLWVKPIQKVAFAGILFWGFSLMVASTALFFLEHPHWQSGLRSAWELLCLLPNAGLSFAIWSYVNWKKKADNF
jgi:hypothetical protein